MNEDFLNEHYMMRLWEDIGLAITNEVAFQEVIKKIIRDKGAADKKALKERGSIDSDGFFRVHAREMDSLMDNAKL